MSEYNTKIINRLCVEFYNNLSGDSNELSLLEGLRQFDFEAFLDEQQERSKKGLQPSSVLRLLMWNMVDYLVKSYSTWGEKKETADITGDLIEVLSDTIVKGYISSYGDNEFYINALGQVRKRESALPEANKAQENQQQVKGKRGRPKKPFKNLMQNDADGSKLEKIRAVMQGKKGKSAALVILAAMDLGWIEKPTYAQVKEEFGDIGVRQGYTSYLNKLRFYDDDIAGMKKALEG